MRRASTVGARAARVHTDPGRVGRARARRQPRPSAVRPCGPQPRWRSVRPTGRRHGRVGRPDDMPGRRARCRRLTACGCWPRCAPRSTRPGRAGREAPRFAGAPVHRAARGDALSDCSSSPRRVGTERGRRRGGGLPFGTVGSRRRTEAPRRDSDDDTARDRIDYSLGVDDASARACSPSARARRGGAARPGRAASGRPGVDLGCGPLGVFAERVGPAGRVVGIDREKRYLAIARQELDARGLDRRRAPVAADATGDSIWTPASFDLVHERLVLNNVPQPDAVVAEMVRLARPGGHVAVQDVDWLTWTCLPEHARLGPAPRPQAAAVWSGDVHLGRRLPALLRAAGLVDVEMVPHLRVFRPGEPLPPAAGAVRRAAPGPHPRGGSDDARCSSTPPSRGWRAHLRDAGDGGALRDLLPGRGAPS